jgi:uncharacterized protein (DUF58 family)
VTGRLRLTGAGFGAILIALLMLAAGLMKTINLLILLGDLLLVFVALNAVIARRSTKSLRVIGEANRDHFAGSASVRSVAVANDSPRAATLTLREVSAVHDRSAFVAAIPPGQSRRVRFAIKPKRRGVHPVSTSIISGFPFGFVTFHRQLPPGESLTVFPALGRLDPAGFRRWLHRAGAGDARSRRAVNRASPQLADLRGVRPFRSGDSPRLIHWRTTARRNELMVRDFDTPDALDLVLLVEPWLPVQATAKDRVWLEHTISLAATLIEAWCDGEQTPRITLVVPDVETIEGRASSHLMRRMLRSLAGIKGGTAFQFDPKSPSLHSPRVVRLLVSSRPKPGPLAGSLRQHSGRAWQRLSPRDAPAWYHPPK